MRKTVAVASRHLRKHGVDAEIVEVYGPIPAAIHDSAVKAQCDLIITGGYSEIALLGGEYHQGYLVTVCQIRSEV